MMHVGKRCAGRSALLLGFVVGFVVWAAPACHGPSTSSEARATGGPHGGQRASLSMMIETGDQTVNLVDECEQPEDAWIWCDDFERDRLGTYFEIDRANGQLAREAGVGVGGSSGLRVRYEPGRSESGNLKLAFGATPSDYMEPVDDGTRRYRELYWRHFLRHPPDWTGGHPAKLTRATVFAGSDWSQAMIAHLWGSSDDVLALDPASGTDATGALQTTRYNDFDNLRWLGIDRGETPIFDDRHVGEWYCVEAHVRLNDPGEENGVFEFWIDDALEARSENLNWLGSYDAYGINAVFFENYWNDTSPVIQERYWDNIVVSTERIGC